MKSVKQSALRLISRRCLARSSAGRFSSPELIAVLSTNTMRPRESFTFVPATKWKRNWWMPIRQLRCVSARGYRPSSGNKSTVPNCRPSPRARTCYQRDAPYLVPSWLSIASRGSAPFRSENRGGFDDLPARNRQFCSGGGKSSADLCDAIGAGDSKRAALPRDRGQKVESLRPPTATSRSFSPTCRMSCVHRSTLLSGFLKFWGETVRRAK